MKKILIVLAILIPASLRAQSAFPDSSGPTSAGCYRLAVPPLTEAPPLHTDMSLDCLLGYVYLDSIMRAHITDTEWAAFNAIQSFDSLKYLLKYLYAISDYDPVLLAEYGADAPYINPSYTGKPIAMISYIARKIGSVLRASGDTTGLMYLTSASYILHIRVKDTFQSWDSMGHFIPGLGNPEVCIEAIILDTIKGQHILSGECNYLLRVKKGSRGNEPVVDSAPGGGCIHFSYNAIWNKSGSDFLNSIPVSSDSIIFSPDAMGWNALAPDSEYIVMLSAIYEDYDGTNSYFSIRPIMDGAGGIYPVIGGMVSDPKNIWRMGTSVGLSTFESGLRARIYKIQNP